MFFAIQFVVVLAALVAAMVFADPQVPLPAKKVFSPRYGEAHNALAGLIHNSESVLDFLPARGREGLKEDSAILERRRLSGTKDSLDTVSQLHVVVVDDVVS
jgi:hypothetical protein